jgi:predicted XRE-type DNA-binding protein
LLKNQTTKKITQLENQLYFNWIDDRELKTQLSIKVTNAKNKRTESQKEVSKTLEISLTKIKEIEKGTCKDFNAINNYLNYFSESLF